MVSYESTDTVIHTNKNLYLSGEKQVFDKQIPVTSGVPNVVMQSSSKVELHISILPSIFRHHHYHHKLLSQLLYGVPMKR
mgnify:CR=1 FL=1